MPSWRQSFPFIPHILGLLANGNELSSARRNYSQIFEFHSSIDAEDAEYVVKSSSLPNGG
jgi:hypothetical protein